MEVFFKNLQQRYKLSDTAIEQLREIFKPLTYKKKEIFGGNEKKQQSVFFVANGLVRAFLIKENTNYTVFFAFEDQMLNTFPDQVGLEHPHIDYEALEDTLLYKVSKIALENLFQTSLELSNWGRKLLEEKIIEFNNYFINYFYEEKRTQYKKILAEHPNLIQRVALKDLATYLNMTPQSLSRIRAEI